MRQQAPDPEYYPSLQPGDYVWLDGDNVRYIVTKAYPNNGGIVLAFPPNSEEAKLNHTMNTWRGDIRKATRPDGTPVPRLDAATKDDEVY